MNRLLRHATLMLSRLLDPQEREVALGDVAELGYTGGQAFTSMLGLVLRRQWRPWFVLVTMVVPIATLLASFCNDLGCKLFPILVMWSHHHLTYATGLKPSAEAFGLFLKAAALALWSWTCAFAVGVVARGTKYVPSIAFCLVCVAMGWRFGPISIVLLWATAWGWLPVLIVFLLVLTPAYHGLRHGAAFSKLGEGRLVFLLVGMAVAGILALWTQGWDRLAMENWSRGGDPLTLVQLVRSGAAWEAAVSHLLAISLLTSPVLYLLTEQIARGMGKRAWRQRL